MRKIPLPGQLCPETENVVGMCGQRCLAIFALQEDYATF